MRPSDRDAADPAGNPFGVTPGTTIARASLAQRPEPSAPTPANLRSSANRAIPRVGRRDTVSSATHNSQRSPYVAAASLHVRNRSIPARGSSRRRTLYRRTHGADAADATRLRWDWQHRRNPYNPTGQPGIWVAREGPTVVGHYPTLPVRVSLKGLEVDGAWGADAMVAPERDRQGLGEALVRAWDRNSGAVLALGLSDGLTRGARPAALAGVARRAVPGEAADAPRRAAAASADAGQPADLGGDASARAGRGALAAAPRRVRADPPLRRAFTALWERLAPKFDLAVRRDAPYLNWRYIEPPHVRYRSWRSSVRARCTATRSTAIGTSRSAGSRCSSTFWSIPTTCPGSRRCCAGWTAPPRAEDSDKVRCYVMHGAFRRVLRRNGYFNVKSTLEVSVKVNAVQVPEGLLRRDRRLAHHLRRLGPGSLMQASRDTSQTPTSPRR